MNPHLAAALDKLNDAADQQHSAELSWMECRVLLATLETWRSTAAITTTPSFHDRVQRYRKTGKL
jgi:hypothetical protein